MKELPDEARPRRREELASETIDGEQVLVDERSGELVHLNRTAALIRVLPFRAVYALTSARRR